MHRLTVGEMLEAAPVRRRSSTGSGRQGRPVQHSFDSPQIRRCTDDAIGVGVGIAMDVTSG